MNTEATDRNEPPRQGHSPLIEGLGLEPKRGLLTRLNSLKVLLGTDSPEVRGWAPVVQQNAQATVNAAIVALKQCGGDNCMGQRVQGVTQWVTEQAAEARVAAERERWKAMMQRAIATCFHEQAHREVMSDPHHFAAEALRA